MTGMRDRGTRRWRLVIAGAGILAALVWLSMPYVRSAALLLDMTGAAPGVRRWLPVRTLGVDTRDVSVPTRTNAIPARLYTPRQDHGPTIVVFPGVHGGGVDEPRLAALSRRLAAAGATVLSTPIPELRRYQLTPRATDAIEDVIRWTAANHELAPRGRVGVVGISFAGGLALVATGRPGMTDLITAVFTLGAYADLPRVIRYLCLDSGAQKNLPPPHDYGVALMLRTAIPLVVPPDQQRPLDEAITTFLDASSAESTNAAEAQRLFAQARAREASLPEPSRTLMQGVNDRNLALLGPKLAPYAEQVGGDAALSPARSPATRAPVFLLHGERDNVIPADESRDLQRYLNASGNTRVELLVTPLISHADNLGAASSGDLWRLVSFWTRMWKAFESPESRVPSPGSVPGP
jgi:dienelactone hydrolase